MSKHPHIEIRRMELAELASKAFKVFLVPNNITAGFRRTRIWPLNSDALRNDMKPSDAFNVEEENFAEGIASILRLAGYDDGNVIKDCVAQMAKQQQDDSFQSQNPPLDVVPSTPPVDIVPSNLFETGMHDDMSFPTQFDPPDWVKEGAKELGVQIEFQNEDISLSIPSPPSMPREEVVHYYAEGKIWETIDHNEDEVGYSEHNLEASKLDNTEDEGGLAEHNLDALKGSVALETEDEEMLCSQGSLRSFLKLPIERVTKRSVPSDKTTLRLGRKSQILTSNEYIMLQEKQEARKVELQ